MVDPNRKRRIPAASQKTVEALPDTRSGLTRRGTVVIASAIGVLGAACFAAGSVPFGVVYTTSATAVAFLAWWGWKP